MMERIVSAWTGQPASAARVEPIEEVDQWTLQSGLRNVRPLWKYSWPNGDQVYISEATGEVVQYTTTASRLGAYVGAIPHWLYFTPLRRNGPLWSQVVIWTSGIGTVSAILGIVIGVWMYSPTKRYRYPGAPTSIPYRGQKRWHTVLRTDLRPGRRHVGVQRHAVDGSVSDAADREGRPAAAGAAAVRAFPRRCAAAAVSWRRSRPSTRGRRWRNSRISPSRNWS